MPTALVSRIRRLLTAALHRAHARARAATRPTSVLTGLAADAFRSREELIAENALLRQRLVVAARACPRPGFKPFERALLVVIASLFRRWQSATLLVRPETVLRWHRYGFRLFWRWKSRRPRTPAPRVPADTVELIR